MKLSKKVTSPLILASIGIWISSLALYLATLGQTLTWGYNKWGVDGGELLAAANTMGVPHPPGYPTYMLLLKTFATIIPIGDFAFRGNLLSAILASLSVVLLYWVIIRFCRYLQPNSPVKLWILSGVIGALVFATSPLLWSQAVMTEVYTLNTFLVGVLLFIATRLVLRSPGEKELNTHYIKANMAAFALILGIGLGNHLTILAIGTPLLFWLWRNLGTRKMASTWTVAAFLVGISVYIYLPIRAAQNPPINWGEANSFAGFVWIISARVYQDYLFGVNIGSLGSRTLDWLILTFSQFNPLGIFLGLVGASSLRAANLGFLTASFTSIVVLLIYSITYNTVDSEVMTLPAFMLFSLWLGIGFHRTLSDVTMWIRGTGEYFIFRHIKITASRSLILLGLIALGAMPVTSVILNYNSQNLRHDNRAYDYAKEIIDKIPDGSVVLSTEEDATFSLWYIRHVEETERDVATLTVPLLNFDWYWNNVTSRFPDRIPPGVPENLTEGITRIVEHNDGKSKVFFTYWNQLLDELFLLDMIETGSAGQLLEARMKIDR